MASDLYTRKAAAERRLAEAEAARQARLDLERREAETIASAKNELAELAREELSALLEQTAAQNVAEASTVVNEHARLMNELSDLAQQLAQKLEETDLFGPVEAAHRQHQNTVEHYAALVQQLQGVGWQGEVKKLAADLGSEQRALDNLAYRSRDGLRQSVTRLKPVPTLDGLLAQFIHEARGVQQKRARQALVFALIGELLDPPPDYRPPTPRIQV